MSCRNFGRQEVSWEQGRGTMQQEIFYPMSSRVDRKTPLQMFGAACYKALILCIALPLACCVVLVRGGGRVFRFLASLSFICCVWVFLAVVVLLFLLAITVHLAVASVG